MVNVKVITQSIGAFLILAVGIASPFCGVAQAATPKQRALTGRATKIMKSKKLKARLQSTPRTSQIATPVQQPAQPSVMEAQISPPAHVNSSQVSASLHAPVAEPKKRWSIKYRSYNAIDITAASGIPGSDTEVRAWDRLNLSYSLTDSASVSLMPQWNHTWFGDRARPQVSGRDGYTQPYSAFLGNTALMITESKLLQMGEGFVADGQLRYDLPTSEDAQKAESYGDIWTSLGVTKPIGIVTIKWSEIFRYHMHNYYTSSIVDRATQLEVQNLQYRIYSLLDLGVDFTSKLSFTLETGLISTSSYGDGSTNRTSAYTTSFALNPDLTYAFNKIFALSLGLFESKKLGSMASEGYVPFSSDNGGEGYLMLTIKI